MSIFIKLADKQGYIHNSIDKLNHNVRLIKKTADSKRIELKTLY